MTLEIYSIPTELIIKLPRITKQTLLDYLAHECVCEHITYAHTMNKLFRPDTLTTEVAFTDCRVCECKMFKRDNLKYLEKLTYARDSL